MLFRNYLRAHIDEANAYSKLKRALAEEHSNNRDAYTQSKDDFIVKAIARAIDQTSDNIE